MLNIIVKDFINGCIKGWKSGGIPWREQFVESGIDPDKFLKLVGKYEGRKIIARYWQLSPRAKIEFLNSLAIKYHELKLNLF